MENGTIVEYIDQQKIICAIVIGTKNQRLRLLTETNREVNISSGRLSHKSDMRFDPGWSRDNLVNSLKELAVKRKNLMFKIDIKELWDVLHEEPDWIDVSTMTEYCFTGEITADHESAVIRSFFDNRTYFKFNNDSFFPHTEKQVEQIIAQKDEEERKNRIIEDGGTWLKNAISDPAPKVTSDIADVIKVLKSSYLFEKESKHFQTCKAILKKAGVDLGDKIFDLFVKLGIWSKYENLDLLKNEVQVSFPTKVLELSNDLKKAGNTFSEDKSRKDLTDLPLMTIDGESTRDFDDAISLEKNGDSYTLGVHIIDVAHYIKRGDSIDQTAMNRASSIYMPDRQIPMLPKELSEELCSLREGELRPAISIMISMNRFFQPSDYEIVPSIIKVHRQLTYSEVAGMVDTDEEIKTLYKIGLALREKRFDAGAVQINLPEISVNVDEDFNVSIKEVDRESPGRMFIAEMMIIANNIMAKHLAKHEVPAIFRSQPEPKARLFKGVEESLFMNCMQRKQLSRAVIGHEPEPHSGLGLDAYVTCTSPIRKYYDLVTQRQLKSTLGMDEKPYDLEEIKQVLMYTEQPVGIVGKIQFSRRKFWILKYLEAHKGNKFEAIVLDKRRDAYFVMIKEFMLECKLPASGGTFNPKDIVQVVIQHADAKNDNLSIFAG